MINRVVEDGDDPLFIGHGMSDYLSTHPGTEGVGADDEQEIVGGFNGGKDLRPPLGGVGNAAPVDPGLALQVLEGGVEIAGESLVCARLVNRRLALRSSNGQWTNGVPGTSTIAYRPTRVSRSDSAQKAH